MQSLHIDCTALRNKNNPTTRFLQEFFGTKLYFPHFAQRTAVFFVKIVENTSDGLCAVCAIRCANIDIVCARLYNRGRSYRRNRLWQLPSKMSQRRRGSRLPPCPAPARTAPPSAGRPKSGCAASWRSWAMNRTLRPNRWRRFPRPSASFCPPRSGTSMRTLFIWRSSAASGSFATSGGM